MSLSSTWRRPWASVMLSSAICSPSLVSERSLSGRATANRQVEQLDGTPCRKVIEGETCHYVHTSRNSFRASTDLVTLGVTSYLAVPLKDPKGKVLGHLVAMDVKPMVLTTEDIEVFKLFGERAGVEIYRQVIEWSLQEREATMRAIAEGTAADVGGEFFLSP